MGETPHSYLTNHKSVCAQLDTLGTGQVREIARSPGGRPLHAVSYGEFEPIERRANHSAALSAGDPQAFLGPGRQKPVLVISAAVHGAEMESIAALMHLLSLLETGSDLDGGDWPQLLEHASAMRLVMVPVANPDGRARIDSDDPLEWSEAEMEKYRHGLGGDGAPTGWMPGCFSPHPKDPARETFLGGYFNDAGVNPTHGAFLDPAIAPEAHALIDLAHQETADCYLELHSCGAGPFFILGSDFIPADLSARHSHFDGAWRTRMRRRNLPAPNWSTRSRRQVMGLGDVVYHKAGSLPLLFEGGAGVRYGGDDIHRQIVDTYLLLFETVCEIAATEGLKG